LPTGWERMAASMRSTGRPKLSITWSADKRNAGTCISVTVETVAVADVPIFLYAIGMVQAYNIGTIERWVDGQIPKWNSPKIRR
jgi:hypothetical protein